MYVLVYLCYWGRTRWCTAQLMVSNFGEELRGAVRTDVSTNWGILAVELKRIIGNLTKIVYILVLCAFMILIGLFSVITNYGCKH